MTTLQSLFPLTAILVLSACAQNPYFLAAEAKLAPRIEAEVVNSGEQSFCKQPAWQKCLGVSESQCFSDMAGLKEACHAESKALSGPVVSQSSSTLFMNTYLMCLGNAHVSASKKSRDEINQCVSQNPANKEISLAWANEKLKPLFDEAKREAKEAQAKAEGKNPK